MRRSYLKAKYAQHLEVQRQLRELHLLWNAWRELVDGGNDVY